MPGNNQICSPCGLEGGVKGCICRGTVKLIGNSCLVRHISESEFEHNLIDLDLALRMQQDPSLIDSYLKRLPRLQKVTRFLVKSSDAIQKCRILVKESKKELITRINWVFDSLHGAIEHYESEVDFKLKCLNKYKSSFCEEGGVLMEEYKARGRRGFIQNSIKAIEIPIDEIAQFISDSIKLHTSNSTVQDSRPNTLQDLRIKLQEKDAIIQEQSKTISENIHKIEELTKLIQMQTKEINQNKPQLPPAFLNPRPLKNYRNSHTFTVNPDSVCHVCMSSDGKFIVSGNSDKSVVIWNAFNKTQEARLTGHEGWVSSVCMSRDARLIISGSSDNTVRIWDAVNKTQVAKLTGHSSFVYSVCISRDARFIASGSQDNTVRIWDVWNKTQEGVLNGHARSVSTVCMSGDGRLIVSGSSDRTIRIWNVRNKSQEGVLNGHTSDVTSVSMSEDGRFIVSGAGYPDNTVRIWNAFNKTQEAILHGHTGTVRCICITVDGGLIVSGSEDTTIRIWNVRTKTQEALLTAHTRHVNSVCVSEDGRFIVSGSEDNTLRIWS